VTPRPFLTARWANLVLLSFEVPAELVRAHLPPGVEPDRWNGRTHASLVALEMRDVRLRGWRIPGFAAHPQVNFRVYARHRSHAAVAFVRELVPSRLIAAVGRLRFREPFRAARIEAQITEGAGGVSAVYRFGLAAPEYRIVVTGSLVSAVPGTSSFEHYLKERTHGCGTDWHGRVRVFRVKHPPWAVRKVVSVDYAVDFAALYGPEWQFLNHTRPVSTILAAGSDVSVYPPQMDRR
jgi:uncharacterized protein